MTSLNKFVEAAIDRAGYDAHNKRKGSEPLKLTERVAGGMYDAQSSLLATLAVARNEGIPRVYIPDALQLTSEFAEREGDLGRAKFLSACATPPATNGTGSYNGVFLDKCFAGENDADESVVQFVADGIVPRRSDGIRLADVGCGNFRNGARVVDECNVRSGYAIDSAPSAAYLAGQRVDSSGYDNVHVIQRDSARVFRNIIDSGEPLDALLGISVFHLEDREGFEERLRTISQAMRSGAVALFLLKTPDASTIRRSELLYELEGGVVVWSPDDGMNRWAEYEDQIVTTIESVGLKVFETGIVEQNYDDATHNEVFTRIFVRKP